MRTQIINHSSKTNDEIQLMLPMGLNASRIIVFPDICKVRWRIPTGMAILTTQKNWRKFAISDVGCGMLLCKSNIKAKDFDKILCDELYYKIISSKHIGDLGTGNHFIDVLKSKTDESLYFLVHCGGDKNIALLEKWAINNYAAFDNYYDTIIQRAKESRYAIYEMIQSIFGKLEFMLDRNHNHYENTEGGVIIRRGAVKILPNETTIIPSNLCGDVALVKATDKISDVLFSISHGTGRLIAREETDKIRNININVLREKVYIPSMIPNENLKMDTPDCYRDLDSCLQLIDDLIQVDDKYTIIGYIGQMN